MSALQFFFFCQFWVLFYVTWLDVYVFVAFSYFILCPIFLDNSLRTLFVAESKTFALILLLLFFFQSLFLAGNLKFSVPVACFYRRRQLTRPHNFANVPIIPANTTTIRKVKIRITRTTCKTCFCSGFGHNLIRHFSVCLFLNRIKKTHKPPSKMTKGQFMAYLLTT